MDRGMSKTALTRAGCQLPVATRKRMRDLLYVVFGIAGFESIVHKLA